jgi:outer membrane protein
LSLESVTLTDAENDLAMAKIALMQLIEIPAEESFEVERPLLPEPTFNTSIQTPSEQIYKNALTSHPQIKSLEYSKKSALSTIRSAQGARLPQLTLNTSIFTFYSSLSKQYRQGIPSPIDYPFYNQLNDQIGEQVSLNLTFPILNNRIFTTNIERAKINYKMAELNERSTKNELRKNIEQTIADIKSAEKKVVATSNALASSERAYLSSEKRLKAGLINPSEFIIQKNNFVLAQSLHIQSKYNYTFKVKLLEFYQSNDRNTL